MYGFTNRETFIKLFHILSMTVTFLLHYNSHTHTHTPYFVTAHLHTHLAVGDLPSEPVNKKPIIQLINNLIKARWHVSRA